MSAQPSDEDLMLAYREGDAAAFECLYTRHKGGLYRYFLRQCGDSGVAEELYQEVWMKVIRGRGRYEVRAKFTTWLYQMAHHRLIDHYRRHRRQVPVSFGDDVDPDGLAAEDSGQPDRQFVSQLAASRILALIDSLPEAQREAFLLKEEGGLSIEEIAEVAGVNRETAKSRLRYAVNRLRRGLKDLMEDGQ